MKKEVILAIILGIFVALGLTFFIYQSNQNSLSTASDPAVADNPVAPANLDSLPEKADSPIRLTFPENEAVFEEKAITITGHTQFINTPIVIFINQKDFLATSDDQGNFSLSVNLESGGNIIMATVIDDQGASYSDQVIVVYSNKSLEETLVSDDELISSEK